MSWPTGDSISGQLITVRFLVPYNDWVIQSLVGALNFLMNTRSWDETGLITAREAAELFERIYFSVREQPVTVGSIWWFPNDNMQYINQDPAQGASQFLKCDGALVSVISYPDLYAIVGNLYGGDSTAFNLPDLRGRAAIGTGTGSGLTNRVLGTVLGEEDHTLSTAEMPGHSHSDLGHSHTESGATPSVTSISPGAPEPTALAVPTVTGTGFANLSSSGGGGSHNNMQPSSVLTAYIQAFA
jgi:microcystin-dependent protein